MLAKAEAGLSASPVTESICSQLWWRFDYEDCVLLCRHTLESYWDNLLQRNSGYCSGETAFFPYGFTLLEVRSKNCVLMGEEGFLQDDLLGFLCSIYFLLFRVDWGTSDRILVLPGMLLVNYLAFHSLTIQGHLQPPMESARPGCYGPYLQGSLPYGILGEDTVHFNAIQMSRFLFFITPLHLEAIHQRPNLTLKGMLCPLCPFNRTFGSKISSVDHTCATDVWACVAKIKNKKNPSSVLWEM